MKQSHSIPKGWRNIKLKKLLTQEIKNGYSPNCPEEPNGSWILGLGNLTENGFDPSQAKPAPKNDAKVKNFLLKSGDFLISRSNTLDKVGRTMLFRGELENCSYPDLLMRFRINENQVANDFLEGYLRSSKVRRYIQSSASGTSGSMVKINKTVVEKIPVLLPPLSEQKAIADLLSTWDKAIEKTERLIGAKQRRFRWLLRSLISDQCSMNNGKWKKVKLGEVITERVEKSKTHDQYPVLTSSRKGLFYQSDYFSKQVTSKSNDGYKIVYKGDFTYRAMSDDGKFAFNRLIFCEQGIISPAYGVFYPINIDTDFLLFYLNSSLFYREVLKISQGGTRISLKLNAIKKMEANLPDITEQRCIADVLSTAQKEIDLLKQLAEKYKTQKRGLMQKILTGEWRMSSGFIEQFSETNEENDQ